MLAGRGDKMKSLERDPRAPARVILVDDHELLLAGLRALLETEGDLRVVGEAKSGADAVSLASALAPDVVIMDVIMAGLSGVEATREVLAAVPTAKVIALSGSADPSHVREMFGAGAAGYVVKSAAANEVVRAVRAVLTGGRYVSPIVARDPVHARAPDARGEGWRLSEREREVLRRIARGRSSKEIAAEMAIAVSTVETYRRHIARKLDLHSVADITRFAIRHGLASSD